LTAIYARRVSVRRNPKNCVLGVRLSGSQKYGCPSLLNWDCKMDDEIIHLPFWPNPSNCLFWLLQCLHMSFWIDCGTSKNSSNKIPSLSWKTLVMAVPAEVCTLSLLSLVLATVPIYRPPSYIFVAARRMRSYDAVLKTITRWKSVRDAIRRFSKDFHGTA
jgi:hypothetical protein